MIEKQSNYAFSLFVATVVLLLYGACHTVTGTVKAVRTIPCYGGIQELAIQADEGNK